MFTIILILILIAVVIFTHFVVSYLIENNIKLVAIIFALLGILTSIFILYLIINNLVSFVAEQLDFFYRR